MKLEEYLWIAIAGGIFGFVYCFSIGANDVANAFATSVASKSITLKQAVVIASIFEFCGVLFLGASVASTVRGKIFDAEQYEDEPEIVMLGMFTSLVAASFMMMGATKLGLPVSTTHTVIGCIIGFTIAAKGFGSVNWGATSNIFLSWVIAPPLTGAIGFGIFFFIRHFILLGTEPFRRGYYTFSFILFATISINLFFIFSKGTKNFEHFQNEVYDIKWVLPTSFGAGALVGLLWVWPVGPIAKRKMEARRTEQAATEHAANAAPPQAAFRPAASVSSIGSIGSSIGRILPAASVKSAQSGSSIGTHHERSGSQLAAYDPEQGAIRFAISESVKSLKLTIDSEVEEEDLTEHAANIDETVRVKKKKKKTKTKKSFLVRFEEATYKQNLEEQSFLESKATQECWENAAQYDSDVEQLFSVVQVFTASLSSFAHGANDIANSIAPLSAIIAIYRTGELDAESPVQKWILAYGGVALSLGLLLYGYNVMKTIGYKLTALSPTRGSSASLASSLTVATASYIGIPVSTTQCIVGAVTGIGLVEGRKNVQWLQLGRCVVGWVLVFFVAVIFSAGLFAFCAYSPSLTSTG